MQNYRCDIAALPGVRYRDAWRDEGHGSQRVGHTWATEQLPDNLMYNNKIVEYVKLLYQKTKQDRLLKLMIYIHETYC